jgi:hypothetical protein
MVLQMMTDVLDAVDFLHRQGIIYLYWSCKFCVLNIIQICAKAAKLKSIVCILMKLL